MTARLYSYATAAELLDTSVRTVQRLVQSGNLVAVTLGSQPRIPSDALEAYIANLPEKG